MLGKDFSRRQFEIAFLFFPKYRLLLFMQIVETIDMNCQILFFGENKKSVNLLSAEFQLRVVKVKDINSI